VVVILDKVNEQTALYEGVLELGVVNAVVLVHGNAFGYFGATASPGLTTADVHPIGDCAADAQPLMQRNHSMID
jgi:hypothetical protein